MNKDTIKLLEGLKRTINQGEETSQDLFNLGYNSAIDDAIKELIINVAPSDPADDNICDGCQ